MVESGPFPYHLLDDAVINQPQGAPEHPLGPTQGQGPSPINWKLEDLSKSHPFIHEIISVINVLDTALGESNIEIHYEKVSALRELTPWKGDSEYHQ